MKFEMQQRHRLQLSLDRDCISQQLQMMKMTESDQMFHQKSIGFVSTPAVILSNIKIRKKCWISLHHHHVAGQSTTGGDIKRW